MSLPVNQIVQGDCLEVMPDFPEKSSDLVACDLPYGVTKNDADKPINLSRLWEQYRRVSRERAAILLTSQFPFTIDLINSNREWFKYDLIWDKVLVTGFLNAKRMPLRIHEHILVFYDKTPTFNPQFETGVPSHSKGRMKITENRNYGEHHLVDNSKEQGNKKYPKSIITFQKPHPSKASHPTEKPVGLMEYLIKSYSNEGDVVLDNCVGTGATAIAAKRSNRQFIGIELNPDYVEMAKRRLSKVEAPLEVY